jgi:hypothetical protein
MGDVTTHCFFRVAFNDRVPQLQLPGAETPTENEVRLTLPIYLEKAERTFSRQEDVTCALSRLFIFAGKVEPMPWRTLEMEVTPERIKVRWEGERIISTRGGQHKDGCDPKMPLQLASGIMGNIHPRHKDGPPEPVVIDAELALGGGLGLYVEQGVAAFRSVVIEPLPSQ